MLFTKLQTNRCLGEQSTSEGQQNDKTDKVNRQLHPAVGDIEWEDDDRMQEGEQNPMRTEIEHRIFPEMDKHPSQGIEEPINPVAERMTEQPSEEIDGYKAWGNSENEEQQEISIRNTGTKVEKNTQVRKEKQIPKNT